MIKKLFLTVLFVALCSTAFAVEIDKNIPAYKKVQGVAGTLNSVGSDTLNNMMAFWTEGFRKQYPNVKIQVEGKGSSTAPPALIEGVAQLGPMSRKMKASETQKFESKYGYKPTMIGVALDSLAVFVNKDNPITGLSLQEVDAIFSSTRAGGLDDITSWDQLGWGNGQISLYGRNSASGTYGYFKKHALFKGDYKNSVKEQPGSASVVLGITEDTHGIGYSGVGYTTSGVKAIALGKKKGDEQFEPNYENVMNGKYPLSRMLYIYVNKEPNKPMTPVVKEFIKYVLSKEGQEIVVKDGYLPLTNGIIEKQLKIIE